MASPATPPTVAPTINAVLSSPEVDEVDEGGGGDSGGDEGGDEGEGKSYVVQVLFRVATVVLLLLLTV